MFIALKAAGSCLIYRMWLGQLGISPEGAYTVSDGNSCQKREVGEEGDRRGVGGGRLVCVFSHPSETVAIARAFYCKILSYSSDIKQQP